MNQTLIQIQVFYEIASAIGNSPYLEQMARDSLSAYLHKLNCSTGMVLHEESEDDGSIRFRSIAVIPRRACASSALEASLRRVPLETDLNGRDMFYRTLPLSVAMESGKHCYIMSLPNFGLLILVKSGEPFEDALVKSLARLNHKFAEACRVCLHSEAMARINEKLRHEIEERIRAEAARQQLLEELESRVAARTKELVQANRELGEALANVKVLSGLLPICAVCKKVRDDHGYWNQIESYIARHSDAMFTHGICPSCAKKLYGEFMPEER